MGVHLLNRRSAATVSGFSRLRTLLCVAAVGWAMLVFYLSTARFGGDFSEWLLAQALTFSHVSVSSSTLHILNVLLRKGAHVIEYGTLAFLVYGSFADQNLFRWRLRRACWCVLIAAAYSLTDEFHQAFVPGRHASLADCGIDTAGAALAVAIVYQGREWLQGVGARNQKDSPAEGRGGA